MNQRYEDMLGELEKLKAERALRQQQGKAIVLFIRALNKNLQVLKVWDDTIWTVMVDKGVVQRNGWVRFVFNNGMEVEVGGE